MRLLGQMGELEEAEEAYYSCLDRENHYEKLRKIETRLRQKTSKGERGVEEGPRDRIDGMAHLRTRISQVDQQLADYDEAIEEQHFVVEGLKGRSQEVEEEDD